MIFYLKVNREENYTFRNLQQWINITNLIENSKVYIMCDKKTLRENILKRINLSGSNYEFLETCFDSKELKYIVDYITDDYWTNAGYAHLSTFLHAKEQKAKEFWNIDADDTSFCLEANRVKELLEKVSKYAKRKKIHAFSLDMWRSREKGEHWSFGITYIDNSINWLEIMRKNCTSKILKDDVRQPKNADGFFTFLKDNTDVSIQTYYFENLRFIHYSDDFFKRSVSSGMFHWKRKKVYFPILIYCFNLKSLGIIDIPSDIIKLSIGITNEESELFLKNNALDKFLIDKYEAL